MPGEAALLTGSRDKVAVDLARADPGVEVPEVMVMVSKGLVVIDALGVA